MKSKPTKMIQAKDANWVALSHCGNSFKKLRKSNQILTKAVERIKGTSIDRAYSLILFHRPSPIFTKHLLITATFSLIFQHLSNHYKHTIHGICFNKYNFAA